MKNFFKILLKWRIWALQAAIIFASGYCIFKTETFQEMISPQKYWVNKIEELESKIKSDRVNINCLRLLIEKEKVVKPFEMKEIQIKAVSSNINVEESLSKLKKEHDEKLQLLKRDLTEKKQMCSLREAELKQAQEKLRQT